MGELTLTYIKSEIIRIVGILNGVEKGGLWFCSERYASTSLRQDLSFFIIYLAINVTGINDNLLQFLDDVLDYDLTFEDIQAIIEGAEIENDKNYSEVLLSGICDVILYSADAEDELRRRGIDIGLCIPLEVAKLFGMVGNFFIGEKPSKAYTMYMMKINNFLAKEGYYKEE